MIQKKGNLEQELERTRMKSEAELEKVGLEMTRKEERWAEAKKALESSARELQGYLEKEKAAGG